MTPGGYSKAAASLAALVAEDRRWLLSQLAEDDRVRLLTFLQDLPAPIDDHRMQNRTESSDRTDRFHTAVKLDRDRLEPDDVRVVGAAEPELLAQLLAREPDWMIAVLLTHAEWPWADAFMESCVPERLERITTAMKTDATLVKLRVRQAILSGLAQKLRRQSETVQMRSAFERVLSRAEEKVSEAWKRNRGET